MTYRCKEHENLSELLFDDLSNEPNNTCDEYEFIQSSNIFVLSDAIWHRRRLNKK